MKKNYTDSDIQKMLVDLAELVPEIDPNDSEWGAFLREFIAARPEIQVNEQFAQELRVRVLARAHQLKTKKRGMLPRWMQLSGMFVTGAAVCALVLVPVLNAPKEYQVHDEMAPRALKMVSNNARSVQQTADMVILEDAETIPEFEIAPMMLQSVDNGEMMAGAGMLNSEVGVPAVMMDGAVNSRMRTMLPQLAWEDMPSDDQILSVAIEFFRGHNFDALSVKAPVIDKWWANEEKMNWQPEFAPDRVGVVFAFDGGEVRIDVDTQTLEVVWMSYSQSQR